MTVQDRQNEIVTQFSGLTDWEDRYKKLIEIGRELPDLPPEKRTEEAKVKGCQSQVWIHARFEGGRIYFEGDSDAILVKGLVALLLKVYSAATPDDILNTPPDFIKDIGLETKLSPSRASGLVSMIKQMRYYALAFKALENR